MRKTSLIVAAGAFALLVAACSAGSDDSAAVRPFSEVQATDAVFENDPTFPGRGILRVDTTEPMICAIVWGETEALGHFNNSLDMNGTGIVEHNVLLPGAEAGGTYFYRLQGSAADGTLYQSELMTFTLPPSDEASSGDGAAEHGVNVAEGATVVEVSSEFSSSWSGANAVDGDLNTEWSSAGDAGDAFITIDLGSAQEIAAVEFLTRTMADGSATTQTFFVVVDDGERLGPFQAGNPANPVLNDVSFTGTVLRFEVEESTGGNTGAIEIRAFSPIAVSGG
ncbi:MAG: discoidin domain-containing protein [Actinomycetota bacterium]|nr:discoidin domain-containing protein [Actinomycetota bacterium]